MVTLSDPERLTRETGLCTREREPRPVNRYEHHDGKPGHGKHGKTVRARPAAHEAHAADHDDGSEGRRRKVDDIGDSLGQHEQEQRGQGAAVLPRRA